MSAPKKFHCRAELPTTLGEIVREAAMKHDVSVKTLTAIAIYSFLKTDVDTRKEYVKDFLTLPSV